MNSIHHPLKTFLLRSIQFSLIAILFSVSTFAAKQHQPKRQRANGRQSPAKSTRSARLAEKVSKKTRAGRHRTSTRELRVARRQNSSHTRRAFAAARRRAEVARAAAAARQRALEQAMRDQVQSMIARDDITGEDAEVRRVAVSALGNHAGTVVVMDPNSGRVLSIVNQQWALHQGFKPCSTIKLVTGLAGLNEKVIDPNDTANVSGSDRVDLTSALARSKNGYFQQVGGLVGFDKMVSYARRLGLGEKTGINAPNESRGSVPSFKSGLAVNHMSSHGDDFKVTALQLATLVSAMGNGGKLLSPQILRHASEESKLKPLIPKVRRQINFAADAWQGMVPGMVGAVQYGSGRRAYDPQAIIAGKTGTCIEQGQWVGLFTSYAPLNNPRLAVVVIARGPDGRNHLPAAVAGQIYRDLNGRFGTSNTMQTAANPETNEAESTTALEKAGVAADDDDEESDEASDSSAAVTTRAPESTVPQTLFDLQPSANSKVRRVLMPIPVPVPPPAKLPAGSKAAHRTATQTQERPRRVSTSQR